MSGTCAVSGIRTLPHGRHGTSDGGSGSAGRVEASWSPAQPVSLVGRSANSSSALVPQSRGLTSRGLRCPPAWIRTASSASTATSATRPCSARSLGRARRSTPSSTSRRRPSSGRRCGPGRNTSATTSRDLDVLEACRRRRRARHRRRVVGQGLRRLVGPAVPRGHGPSGAPPVRRLEGGGGPARPVLCRDLRPARRDHPLRQPLRRRRPELEPDRARHDPVGHSRASARSSAPTAPSSATTSTSTTPRPACLSWPRRCGAPGAAGTGVQLRGRKRLTVLELVDGSCADGVAARARRPRQGAQRDARAAGLLGPAKRVARLAAAGHARRGAREASTGTRRNLAGS